MCSSLIFPAKHTHRHIFGPSLLEPAKSSCKPFFIEENKSILPFFSSAVNYTVYGIPYKRIECIRGYTTIEKGFRIDSTHHSVWIYGSQTPDVELAVHHRGLACMEEESNRNLNRARKGLKQTHMSFISSFGIF